MRRPIIVANWKMNTTLAEAEILLTAYKNQLRHYKNIDIVVCPPCIWLAPMAENLSRNLIHLKLGAQNVYFEDKGAYTGEISVRMLKNIAQYVIIGHSERRKYFNETIIDTVKKINTVLNAGLTPIVCLGEQSKMMRSRRNLIFKELEIIFKHIKNTDFEKIIIAYEPVWAIGTGRAATGAYSAEVISKMREIIAQQASEKIAQNIRILYGGSVESKNISEFIGQPAIDGVLVGGASLKIREFTKICEIINHRA